MKTVTTQSLIAAIQHEDILVRTGALIILAEAGYKRSVEASHVVMDALEKYGWEEAFCQHSVITALPMDEEVANRVARFVPQLKELLDSAWGKHMIGAVVFDWLKTAAPRTCLALRKEMELLANDADEVEHVMNLAEFRISLEGYDAEKCRELLDQSIEMAASGEGSLDDDFAYIQALVRRLGGLKALDEAEARAWIDGEVSFSDPDDIFTVAEIQACVGFEIIKQLGGTIPLEICLPFLELQIGFLSDCIVDILVANADESLMNSLIKTYPQAPEEVREEMLRVFEKVQIPGLEEKIRDLSLLEPDIGMRANLAIIMSVYGSDPGVKYAGETLQDLYGEIEAPDIMEVLYAVNVIRGKSPAEMEEWQDILTEIHDTTRKMMSGEIEISFDDEEFEDDDDERPNRV